MDPQRKSIPGTAAEVYENGIGSVQETNTGKRWDETRTAKLPSSRLSTAASANDGAISKLVALVQPRADNVLDPAIRTLWSLALGNEDHRAEIVAEGAIPRLLVLLRDGSDDQKEIALDLLTLLADDKHCELIIHAGAIAPLVCLLQSHTRSQAESAAFALSALAECNAEYAAAIVLAGALPPLVALFQSRFDYGVYALAKFALTSEENAAELAREGAIPPLVALVKHGSKSQQEAAARALWHVASTSDANRSEIVREGGKGSLMVLLRSGPATHKVSPSEPATRHHNSKKPKATARLLRRLSQSLDAADL